MPAQRGFNLLVVHGDGRRIARVTLPRWLILVVLGLSLAVPASVAVIYTDYLQLRSRRASLNELMTRVAEQQEVIDTSRSKMRQIRAEIDGWRDLQAKIWEPFGPEDGSAKRVTGIGKKEGDNLRALERFLGRATRALAALPSRWPVRGQVNSGYGIRASPWLAKSEFHSGLDIGAPVGTPVKSPAPGTVVFAGVNAEYGQALMIDHGNETKSLYGHLSRLSVAVNENVQLRRLMALTGNTGRSSGPHLHYEIQVKGHAVNPTRYLWE